MRFTKVLGHSIFIIHFVLALVFVFERTLYADSANFIFTIINDEWFAVGLDRYASIFPQIVPLIAIKLNLSLKVVLYAFSISYIVFYYSIFNLVVYKLKNAPIGLAIALSLFLCVEHNYFMVVFEMTQALVISYLLFAFLDFYYGNYQISKSVFFLVSITLVGLSFLCHPASVFSLVFILLFVLVDRKRVGDIKLYGLLVFLFVLIVGKSMLIPSGSYEGGFMDQVANFKKIIPDFFTLPSVIYFRNRFMDLYLFPFVLLLWMMVGYFRANEFLKIGLVLMSIASFLIVSLLIFHTGDSAMMMERVFVQLSVLVLVPFMKDFYVAYSSKLAIKLFFVLVVFISTARIVRISSVYSDRVAYIDTIISIQQKTVQSKFVLNRKSIDEKVILVSWAFSIETLLYSSINGPAQSKTFFLEDDLKVIGFDEKDKELYLSAAYMPIGSIRTLNPHYFQLPNQTYQRIR